MSPREHNKYLKSVQLNIDDQNETQVSREVTTFLKSRSKPSGVTANHKWGYKESIVFSAQDVESAKKSGEIVRSISKNVWHLLGLHYVNLKEGVVYSFLVCHPFLSYRRNGRERYKCVQSLLKIHRRITVNLARMIWNLRTSKCCLKCRQPA